MRLENFHYQQRERERERERESQRVTSGISDSQPNLNSALSIGEKVEGSLADSKHTTRLCAGNGPDLQEEDGCNAFRPPQKQQIKWDIKEPFLPKADKSL